MSDEWFKPQQDIHVSILICCHPPQSSASTRNLKWSEFHLRPDKGRFDGEGGSTSAMETAPLGVALKVSVVFSKLERLRDDDDQVNN